MPPNKLVWVDVENITEDEIMKIIIYLISFIIFVLSVVAEDVVLLKTGTEQKGKILEYEKESFVLRNRSGLIVTHEISDVHSVKFDLDKVERVLANNDNNEDTSQIEFSINELGVYLLQNRREMTGAQYAECIIKLKNRPAYGAGAVLSVNPLKEGRFF